MVLKLYGTAGSRWVRLVATVLLEKKVPFEFILVDFSKREHKSPEYTSKHPFGQVPYIVSCLVLTGNPADSMRSLLLCDLVRTMMASSSMKAEPFVII